MALSESRLRHRARRSYEHGRLLGTWPVLLWLVPVVAISLLGRPSPVPPWLHGMLVASALIALRWRGREYGRGALPGLVAGMAVMAVPIVACGRGMCPVGPSLQLTLLCTGVALVGGLALAVLSYRSGPRPMAYLFSSCLMAALTGVAGCSLAGLAGIAGMAAGLAAGWVPLALWARSEATG